MTWKEAVMAYFKVV